MCNLYSMTKGPQAIRDFARAMRSDVGNLLPLPGVFPDYSAPIVRNGSEGRELVLARWGMPSPFEASRARTATPA
jgi:putative SOS response-associated peptidase YedK